MPHAPRQPRPRRRRIRIRYENRRLAGRTLDTRFRPSHELLTLARLLVPAAIVLAVAGCSQVTPLGPVAPATTPPPRHLASPIILQPLRSHSPAPAGGCPSGWFTISAPGSAGTCYRKLGAPVTITSAAVSPVTTYRPTPPPGQQAQPAQYGFRVAVPAADVAAVTAAIKRAYDAGGALAINIDNKTWEAPQVIQPFPGRQFQIALPSRSQAIQLYRILVPLG